MSLELGTPGSTTPPDLEWFLILGDWLLCGPHRRIRLSEVNCYYVENNLVVLHLRDGHFFKVSGPNLIQNEAIALIRALDDRFIGP